MSIIYINPYRFVTYDLWTPAEMSTILWLDANDTSTVLRDNPGVDDQVYQWNDKSGNNNHATQSNDALKPTWNSAGYVQFTGNIAGGDIMQVTNDPFRDLQNPAIIAVAKYYDPNGQTWSNALATYDGEGLGWQLRQFSTDVSKLELTIIGTAGEATFFNNPPTSITTLSDFIIAGYRKNSDTRLMRGNGTQTGIKSGNDTGTIPYGAATNRSGIGGRFRSDNWGSIQGNLDGHIREIIVADGLSDSNIEKIEGYLAYKWGLSGNLPAGHPYKSEPPYVQ